MDFPLLVAVLAPIVLLAYTTEAFTGFGASVIAVTLGANFYPIEKLVPVIVLLNIIVSSYIGFRHHRHADRHLLLRRILPNMAIGLAIGVAAFPCVQGVWLKWLLGAFVVVFAVRQLYLLKVSRSGGPPISSLRASLFQVLAGVTHAFFSTGGPPLVYSLGRMDLPKETFRATLSLVWWVMSAALIVIFSLNGRIDREVLELYVALIPTMPLGIWMGEKLHGRVDEHGFRMFIYLLLLISGIVLFF